MKVPIWVVKRSGTLNNLIEDVGIDDPVPVPNVNFKTFEMLIPLMREDAWMNAQREKDPLFYVPRKFQPFINQELQQKNINQITELFKAANYLELPFILNGIAAVIADRITKEVRKDVLKALQLPATDEGRAETTQLLQKHNFDSITRMDRNLWQFIAKHLVRRKCRIAQEYSIADYIAEHGQPPLEVEESSYSFDDQSKITALSYKKLTSLYGISLLQHKATVQELYITDNCFYDFALDPQPTPYPFADFASLKVLNLADDNLQRLQAGFFSRLTNLGVLLLYGNNLNDLPTNAFIGLDNLEELSLFQNELIGIHAGAFNGLHKLYDLSLVANMLRNLPAGVFTDLTHLKKLDLSENLLSDQEKERIRAELPHEVEIESGSIFGDYFEFNK